MKFDGHSVPLIAFNYIVILEKLGLADERTTNCSFQKLGSESQAQFIFNPILDEGANLPHPPAGFLDIARKPLGLGS